MKNNQSIGNIFNSLLEGVNTNNQVQTSEAIEKIEELFTDQNKRIDDLRGEIDRLKKKPPKEDGCIKKLLKNNWFIVGIIILLIGFDIFIRIPIVDIQSSYFGAIMGFVGILATFIVVSNYMQVKEIKDEFNARVGELDKAQKETADFTKFLDQFQMGIVDYYQALTLYIDSSNKNSGGLSVYRLFVTSLYHFIQCSGYKGIDSNIKSCLNGMRLSIEKANQKEIELANDLDFGWFVAEISKSNIPEFTTELKQEFDDIELNRREKEPRLRLVLGAQTETGT
jgi:hypothetical protein